MTHVAELVVACSPADELDDVAQIEGEFLEAPCPCAGNQYSIILKYSSWLVILVIHAHHVDMSQAILHSQAEICSMILLLSTACRPM